MKRINQYQRLRYKAENLHLSILKMDKFTTNDQGAQDILNKMKDTAIELQQYCGVRLDQLERTGDE